VVHNDASAGEGGSSSSTFNGGKKPWKAQQGGGDSEGKGCRKEEKVKGGGKMTAGRKGRLLFYRDLQKTKLESIRDKALKTLQRAFFLCYTMGKRVSKNLLGRKYKPNS